MFALVRVEAQSQENKVNVQKREYRINIYTFET